MHHISQARAVRRRSTVAVIAAGVAATLVGAGVAMAAPTASTPEAGGPTARNAPDNAPELLTSEDFEHGVGTKPVMIDQYVGAEGQQYTAAPEWIDVNECNGVVLSAQTVDTAGCMTALRPLAKALGQVAGSSAPETNHVVGAFTRSKQIPANAVEVESLQPTVVNAAHRFVSFGVNAAAKACSNAHPLLNFSLIDGTTEHKISDKPIDPCTDPASKTYTIDGAEVRAGSFVSDGGLLFTGDTLRWVMRNAQTATTGNDGAIDRVSVYDSTPSLENTFSAPELIIGDTGRLTFTIRNTSEHGAKAGWSFQEHLPDGLVLADLEQATTTCTNGGITAGSNAGDVAVHGDLTSGQSDCTVTVDVVAKKAGTFTVGAGTASDMIGLDAPSDAKIDFAPETSGLTVTDVPVLTGGNSDAIADLGESIAFGYHVTNNGNVSVSGLGLESSNGAVDCDADTLAPGASADCTTAPRSVTQADIDAGGIIDSTTVTATTRGGAPVTATTTAQAPATAPDAAAALTLQATVTGPSRPAVGETVGLHVAVGNGGNVTLHGIAATIEDRSGFSVTCPSADLAPGASVDCVVDGTYTVSQADVDTGSISFAANTTATGPSGQAVTASGSTELTTAAPAPAIAAALTTALAEPGRSTVAGDTVDLGVTVRNDGNVTLHGIAVALGDSGLTVDCPAAILAPGASITCAVPGHVLTQSEIDGGRYDLTAVSSARSPQGAVVEDRASSGIDIGAAPAITTVAAAQLAGSDHSAPNAGDEVSGTATITNVGNVTLSSVGAVVGTNAAACESPVVAPGAATTCTLPVHTLTQAEIDEGSLTFAVNGSGNSPDGTTTEAAATVEVSLPASNQLAFSADWTPDTTSALRPKDEVSAVFHVENTSNVTVEKPVVVASGWGEIRCTADRLEPGATTDCVVPKPYSVTGADASAGRVAFEAKAHAEAPRSSTDAVDGSERTADRKLVFSESLTKRFIAEPTPALVVPVLAFTGSDVVSVALPIAIVLVLAGIVLWMWVTVRRRREEGAE